MKTPERGERVTVRWPGGPYDFVIRFDRIEPVKARGWEGWVVIRGLCVSPEGPEHRAHRAFFARPVGMGRYEMLPMVTG